jgi:hypothetical protein
VLGEPAGVLGGGRRYADVLKEIPSMSMSTTALRFELVLATISRCTAWSWRNSGMMLMNIAVIEPGQQAMVERLRRL